MPEQSVSISSVPTANYMRLVSEHRTMKQLLERVLSHPGKNSPAIMQAVQTDIALMRSISETLNQIQNAYYLADPQPVKKVGQMMGMDCYLCDYMPENEIWVRDNVSGRHLFTILKNSAGKIYTDVA